MSKYPNLIEIFPEDIVDQSLTKLEESEEAYKEFLLELCHSYGLELLYAFWTMLAGTAGKLSMQLTLDTFEKLREETNGE